MNERIKELAIKSGASVNRVNYGHGDTRTVLQLTGDDIEKFARSIVQEMCDMMKQCQNDCDTGDASETNWGYISQLQDWIDRFEKHFGVE